MQTAEKVVNDIETRFLERTGKSEQLYHKAKKYLPGGETREAVTYKPYPAFMDRGMGCKLYDIDGNEYLDFLGNYTSLVHGHCDPDINTAVKHQIEKGSVLGSPSALQVQHAAMITDRLPSVEMLRYTNSGTEATMWAIKAARAITGKNLIVKIEGGYHGTHDDAKVGLIPDFMQTGGLPTPTISGLGVPENVLDNVAVVPFNNLELMEKILEAHKGEVAAVLVEPVLASLGVVMPQKGYLKGVRDLADKYETLLIFDEVQTFRLSLGGMQVLEDVKADITALGKLIGGGYAVGAFGGSREIMDRFEFDVTDPATINHSGTFNGNEVTMVAGMAVMKKFDQQAVDFLLKLGQKFQTGMTRAFEISGIKGQLTGYASMWNVHFGDHKVDNAFNFVAGMFPCMELQRLLHLELLNQGIFTAKRGFFVLSTPMNESDVEQCIGCFSDALELLKPYVAEKLPNLLN